MVQDQNDRINALNESTNSTQVSSVIHELFRRLFIIIYAQEKRPHELQDVSLTKNMQFGQLEKKLGATSNPDDQASTNLTAIKVENLQSENQRLYAALKKANERRG